MNEKKEEEEEEMEEEKEMEEEEEEKDMRWGGKEYEVVEPETFREERSK